MWFYQFREDKLLFLKTLYLKSTEIFLWKSHKTHISIHITHPSNEIRVSSVFIQNDNLKKNGDRYWKKKKVKAGLKHSHGNLKMAWNSKITLKGDENWKESF